MVFILEHLKIYGAYVKIGRSVNQYFQHILLIRSSLMQLHNI
jgi:hypothetical protein